MNGQESVAIASVMSENFEPQAKKQRLETVDGVQPMDFQTQMPSKSPEGNYIAYFINLRACMHQVDVCDPQVLGGI